MATSSQWALDPNIIYLDHGAFGACPYAVLNEQNRLRAQMERQPSEFFMRQLEPLLDAARNALAAFIGAEPEISCSSAIPARASALCSGHCASRLATKYW